MERIGSGAYGVVWRARNLATGAARAVKIVFRSAFSDERPFNREFEGIRKFEAVSHTHPSQLALFQVGRNDAAGYFYYVMELADAAPTASDQGSVVSGQSAAPRPPLPSLNTDPLVTDYSPRTLRSDLAAGRLPAARVLELALALTEALAHLHSHGLVHRDIKPANIIFVGGRPKLADIGLVTDTSDSRSIVGTEGYLAPEGPGSPAADLYALGKVCYEMTSGLDRRRFPELPEDLRTWPDRRDVIELNEIVLKACAKDSAQRYPSAEATLADLKLLDAGKSVRKRRAAQRGWAWSWKTAAVLCVILLGFWMHRNGSERRAELAKLNATPFEKSGTTNIAAWRAFERGVQTIDVYTVQSISDAIVEFEKAVVLDPNYARARAILALTLSLQVDYGYAPASNTLPRAKALIEQAISMDPSNGFFYGALAEINLALDYDFESAERLFRKGMQLAPSISIIRHNFSRILIYYGRFEEAEGLLGNIINAEPGKGGSFIVLGLAHGASGRYQEALSSYDEATRLSNRPYLYFNRADLLAGMDDRAGAARDLLKVVELHGFPALDPLADGSDLRQVFAQFGAEEFLGRLIQRLEERSRAGQFVSSYDLARLHAHSNNRARSLDYLERTIAEHRHLALGMKVNPLFKGFHNEPRFHAVLRHLKLEK